MSVQSCNGWIDQWSVVYHKIKFILQVTVSVLSLGMGQGCSIVFWKFCIVQVLRFWSAAGATANVFPAPTALEHVRSPQLHFKCLSNPTLTSELHSVYILFRWPNFLFFNQNPPSGPQKCIIYSLLDTEFHPKSNLHSSKWLPNAIYIAFWLKR